MTELGKRLQKARTALQLSQEYVSKQLNVGRAAISQIELGNRKVSCEELEKFSKIYGISADELLSGRPVEMPSQMFTRKFSELDLYCAFTYSTFTFPSETDRSSSTGPGKLSAQKFFRRGIGLIPSLANSI